MSYALHTQGSAMSARTSLALKNSSHLRAIGARARPAPPSFALTPNTNLSRPREEVPAGEPTRARPRDHRADCSMVPESRGPPGAACSARPARHARRALRGAPGAPGAARSTRSRVRREHRDTAVDAASVTKGTSHRVQTGIRARVKRLEGAYANHCTCSTRRGGRNTRKLSKCNHDFVVAFPYLPRTTEA
jgi:hypothetical protein